MIIKRSIAIVYKNNNNKQQLKKIQSEKTLTPECVGFFLKKVYYFKESILCSWTLRLFDEKREEK